MYVSITDPGEGSATLNFCQRAYEILRFWLHSEVLELIFVIPIYQIMARTSQYSYIIRRNTKYPRINIDIMIRDSRIST